MVYGCIPPGLTAAAWIRLVGISWGVSEPSHFATTVGPANGVLLAASHIDENILILREFKYLQVIKDRLGWPALQALQRWL